MVYILSWRLRISILIIVVKKRFYKNYIKFYILQKGVNTFKLYIQIFLKILKFHHFYDAFYSILSERYSY